jgi:geranylgeranyl pyrophosphate synthase
MGDISQWFTSDHLIGQLGGMSDLTSVIARDWLSGDGKRWRPYLLVSAFQAITGNDDIPEQVKLAAISVEVFHKASLIHDDIQDDDLFRYGKPSIYSAYGVPIALNVGDKLLGDGYRLLSECGIMELVKEASAAHIALCRGQGLELEWRRKPRSLTMDEALYIIENKTVPAFSVALSFAVICADGDETLKTILGQYAYALGMAYQLLDDMADFQSEADNQLRPTSVLAAICEEMNLEDGAFVADEMLELINKNKSLAEQAKTRVSAMVESYRQQAFDSLIPLKNTTLKQLLFRITKKVLS